MWSAVATSLLRHLEARNLVQFEAAFLVVRDALIVCEPVGRQAAVATLFGDFTRCAIAAGLDRTRFVEWFGPAELFTASSGRMRGRVLYFNIPKGRGKTLGADRTVYFVHFSMIRGTGFRSLEAGQLIEFTPQFGVINGRDGWAAYDVARLAEADGTEIDGETR
jgi:cold shock CspA family protein